MHNYTKKMQKPQNIIAQISKNLKEKKWNCLVDNCDQIAINSHLIQQNGLLSNITYNGHLVELKMIDANKWDNKKLPFEFGTVGIKHALTHKVFCNKHDTEIFKPIETDDKNFESYEAFLLFSYRAVCAEIRKKEINVEQFTRMANAKSLLGIIDQDFLNSNIEGNKLGIEDLIVLKTELEKEIENNTDKYKHFVHKYPKLEIYASAIFSANDLDYFSHISEPDLDNVYIHFLPLEDNFLILVGYHSEHVSEKIIAFCNSWKNLSLENLQKKLTTLFSSNVENWGLSTELYKEILDKNKSKYIKTLVENENLYGISVEKDFNLFEK
ncbi:hypothetical protein SAMN05444372_12014 [Flavobacterium micromati]|uniref:Uncharacterized protein n=2 Tax=Flavobacterium micromati TaxID=229205 RepID=A0A1M5QVG5_9FLAO|nr:hypothetical protein SAMN05444372_12014 [Flavobacterium micromati]